MMLYQFFAALLLLASIHQGYTKAHKKAFTAQVVEDIVQNEIAKKMPAAASSKSSKKKSLTGVHLKEATDAINKLVDESIVDRVQEAEKEVSQMLLKSIEHHIQDAGKVLLKQDENTCRDKLDNCDTLSEANICETSKDAMVINCPATCGFCGMLEDLKNQGKIEQEKSEKTEKAEKLPKKKLKHRRVRKHKKKKHTAQKSSNLAPEEVRLIHENMLDQAIDHANLPMAVSEGLPSSYTPTEPQHENSEEREYESDEEAAQVEEQKEREEQQEKQEKAEKAAKERQRKKKKAAAHRQTQVAKSSDQSQGNYLPPNPAGQDEATLTMQGLQDQTLLQTQQMNIPNVPVSTMQYPMDSSNPADSAAVATAYQYNQFTSGIPATMDATKRNGFSATNVFKGKPHNKAAEKTLINKLIKVDLKNSKSKTDMKLKHEIETMVDKAFGELLLKK